MYSTIRTTHLLYSQKNTFHNAVKLALLYASVSMKCCVIYLLGKPGATNKKASLCWINFDLKIPSVFSVHFVFHLDAHMSLSMTLLPTA